MRLTILRGGAVLRMSLVLNCYEMNYPIKDRIIQPVANTSHAPI